MKQTTLRDDIETGQLVDRLRNAKPRERWVIESQLLARGPKAFEAVLEAMRQESADFRKRRRARLVWAFVIIVAALALMTVSRHQNYGFVAPAMSLLLGAAAASQLQRAGANLLAGFDDVRAISPLIDTLRVKEEDLRMVARTALVKLLPKLQATDSALVSHEQWELLYPFLRLDRCTDNLDLTLAILKALEQLGDSRALKPVRTLAEFELPFGRQKTAREAAAECLPFLIQRAEHEMQSQTLLRAVENPMAASATLLRPASGASAQNHEALLRPAPVPEASGQQENAQRPNA